MELLERDTFLADLERLLADAAAGRGRLVFVGGEAGVGKTAFVSRVAESARKTARVLVGACDPMSTPRPLAPVLDIAATVGGTLERLLADSGQPRHRILRAILGELSGGLRPTLAVFEDAHWADEATLDLLRFVGRRCGSTRLLLIVTYRDDEVGPTHPLRVVLGDLATAAPVRRLSLPCLSEAAVRRLAEGSALDPVELHRRTAGNPFFATEALASGSDAIPATVRDAVLARASRLSKAGRATLDAAAVIGAHGEAWLLAEVAGRDAPAAPGLRRGRACSASTAMASPSATSWPATRSSRRFPPCGSWRFIAARSRPSARARRRPRTRWPAWRTTPRAPPTRRPCSSTRWPPPGGRRRSTRIVRPEPSTRGPAASRTRSRRSSAPASSRPMPTSAISPRRSTTRSPHARRRCASGGSAATISGSGVPSGGSSRCFWYAGRNAEAEAAARGALDILEALPPGRELAMAYSSAGRAPDARPRRRRRDPLEREGDRAGRPARRPGDARPCAEQSRHRAPGPRRRRRLAGARPQHPDRRRRRPRGSRRAWVLEPRLRPTERSTSSRIADLYLVEGIAYCIERDLDAHAGLHDRLARPLPLLPGPLGGGGRASPPASCVRPIWRRRRGSWRWSRSRGSGCAAGIPRRTRCSTRRSPWPDAPTRSSAWFPSTWPGPRRPGSGATRPGRRQEADADLPPGRREHVSHGSRAPSPTGAGAPAGATSAPLVDRPPLRAPDRRAVAGGRDRVGQRAPAPTRPPRAARRRTIPKRSDRPWRTSSGSGPVRRPRA